MAQPCFLRDLRLEKTLAWLRKRKRPLSGGRFGCARRRLAALLRVPLSPALAVIVTYACNALRHRRGDADRGAAALRWRALRRCRPPTPDSKRAEHECRYPFYCFHLTISRTTRRASPACSSGRAA